ncbi:MAG: response regulator [Desulfobacteraceae bacterium]|nr:response regulator [Desulfobacteraceae bacterium]
MSEKARILCIDDEEMIRQTIADYLSDSGFEILEAENGLIGLEKFQEETPDLILVDLRMPEFDGLDLLAKINEISPETPVIVVSGTGVLEDAVEALRRGAWNYLTKPIEDLAILEHAVEKALERARLIRENKQYQEYLEQEVKKRTAELHKAHNQLKEQNAFLEALIESIPNPIFYKNVKGEYLGCNKGFCQMLGVGREKIIGSKADDFMPKEHVEVFKDTDRSIFESQNIQTYEYSLIFPDGVLHHLFTNKALFRDMKGEPAGVVGIISDITDLKRSEEEKILLEDQLRHSQKMEAVGTLAGGIAHDFNNILQVISGYMQLLLMKKGKGDPDRKYLAKIDQATERATDLVRHLLTFSRKSEVHFQETELNPLIENTIQLLERTIPRMIDIEIRLVPDLFPIQAAPNQIEQILLNLAGNAFDVMPNGGRLVFETENMPFDKVYKNKYLELDLGDYVLLKVSDTGTGMDDDTVRHIFEPFFTTKEIGKGTGLGLATVYGIVKSHRGRIGCYSEPGTGTTFKIYLPAQNRKFEPIEFETYTESEIQGGNENILIVDDEEFILDIAEKFLINHGYSVKRAGSGEECFDIYSQEVNNIDLVILDLGMPGMGGEKCLAELLKADPKARVVVASGYAAHKMAENPHEHGAIGFICKPYYMDDLLRKIRSILDQE